MTTPITAAHKRAIFKLWRKKLDTIDIAVLLELEEWQVANAVARLHRIEAVSATADRPLRSIVATIAGDPPPGRSALDRREASRG